MTVASACPFEAAEQTLRANGVDLACSDLGSGPIVIYAHGLSSSRATDQQAGLVNLSPLVEAGYRLISYDARGHGDSGGDADFLSYTWSALAVDLLAVIDHFSPNEPVTVFGMSMGTGTLLHAVLQAPDHFSRLVLGAPPTAWETRIDQARLYEEVAETIENGTPEGLTDLFRQEPPAPIFQTIPGYPPASDLRWEIAPAAFRGAGASDLPDRQSIRGITQSTLILSWDTDPGHPVSTGQQLTALIPHAELRIARTASDIRAWGSAAVDFLRESE